MTTSQIEQHPIRHKWYLKGDQVTEKRGKSIIVVDRHELCEFCPTERITAINVRQWIKVRAPRYKYVKGVTILRMTKEEYLRQTFLNTSDLVEEILNRIGGRK